MQPPTYPCTTIVSPLVHYPFENDFITKLDQGIPGGIELKNVTLENIEHLKCLNNIIFPVRYNDQFYRDVLNAGEFAKTGRILSLFRKYPSHSCSILVFLAYLDRKLVGAICCRKEQPVSSTNQIGYRLYIMTLGVLDLYRGNGIGACIIVALQWSYCDFELHSV
jgi:hypothetical protein